MNNLNFLKITIALVVISFVIVFLSGCGIYFFEKDIQPEVFGSVLNSVTYTFLIYTTIGYVNTAPVTFGGTIMSSMVAFVGTIIGILFLVNVIIGTIRACSIIRRETKKHFG